MKRSIVLIAMMVAGFCSMGQRNASMGDRQVAKMKEELSLTDQQVLKLTEINRKFRDEQKRMHSDTSLTRREIADERKEITETREQGIKDVLTKEQYAKWMSMKPARPAQEGRQRRVSPMEEMKEAVGLNDEQVKKITAINTAMGKEFQALRSDSTRTRETRAKDMQAIMTERNDQIKKVLSEEQYTRFLAFERERMKERRGARQPLRR